MRRRYTQLRRTISKYVPNSIKRIKRSVLSDLHELNWPIRGSLYRNYPKVLQTSIPKSGTHLLNQVLERAGYRLYKNQPFLSVWEIDYEPTGILPHLSRALPTEYFIEHITWKEQTERILFDNGIRVIFIYRDPRATAISWCHHIAGEHSTIPLCDYYRELPSLHQRVIKTLSGTPNCSVPKGIGMCP